MIDCPERDHQGAVFALDAWYASTLGRELAEEEGKCLERMLGDTFGYYLLQVGGSTGFAEAIGASRIRLRILLPDRPVANPPENGPGLQILAAPDRLPIASDSVDAVLLPHTLDFAEDARQVLRETERVLIPDGRVVVMGFNALSMWGAWRLVRHRQGRVPWCGNFLTPFRIADWLSLLGFTIEMQETLMFRPPWRRHGFSQRLSFMEGLGRRFWPVLGGVYAIRAVKRVATLTPLRPSWKTRRPPVLAGRAVGPTARATAAGAEGRATCMTGPSGG